MNLQKVLKFEEGLRLTPYICSEGYLTAGFGTKISNLKGLDPKDFPIKFTPDIAEQFLQNDVASMEAALARSSKGKIFAKLDLDRRAIILSMVYQMGVSGVTKFPAMWRALDAQNWEEAGKEALDSVWASQTPERAGRHARVLAGETLVQVYGE